MSAQYAESVPSLTSKSSKYNVYQTDGKPLSSEAIYRAKLKYGIYNNPAKVTLGVDPSASDTAAVLATNTDLSIHSYSKDLSSEAAHAALIAKPEAITAYKRANVAPEAEYAAMSAKSLKFPFDADYEHSEVHDALSSADIELEENAAASVLKKPSKNFAREALQDIYDFDDIRSGKATLSQFTSIPSSKSAKSLSSKKDHRSGIATSNSAAEGSRRMNIGDITKSAKQSATKTLTSRLTPEKDFRSGLKTKNPQNSSRANTMNDSSLYIKNIHNQAIAASVKELNKNRTRTLGIQTASDKGLALNPGKFASSALKTDVSASTDYAAAERATLAGNTLVDQSLYAIAAQKAGKQIEQMNAEAASKTLFSDVKINQIAYQVALENAKKRKETQPGVGEVGLGGGLKMNVKDIEKIASTLVKPAISDMEERIVEMKHIDQQRKELPAKIRERNKQFKEEQRQAQIALEKKRAEEAKARRDQMALDKQAYDEENEQIKAEIVKEYEAKEEEFAKQVEDETAQKKVVDDERAEKLKVLNDEKEAKDSERQGELDDMQKERDDDIAPLLAELETEISKLNELTTNREEKESFYNEEKSKTDALQAELDEVLSKIEILNQRIEELETGVSEVTDQEAAATSAALAAETKLDGEGKEKEDALESLANERKEYETQREALHGDIATKAEQVKQLANENHAEEKEINDIYPEHLRKEIVEPEDFNDEDLNDSKFELDDESIEIPPEVEDEPEDIPEEVWPKVEEPEPVAEDEDEYETEDAEGGIATTKAAPKKAVKKKTWEEIKASGATEGGDPLVNVPTEEKPAMVDIVDDAKVRESINATSTFKNKFKKGGIVAAVPLSKNKKTATTPAAKETTTKSAAATARTTAASTKATTGGTSRNVPVIKSSSTSKGFFGFFKSGKTSQPEFVEKKEVINPAEAKKKFKGLQSNAASIKDDTESIKETKKTKETKETKEATTATTNNDDEDVFSGFSQGSEVEES